MDEQKQEEKKIFDYAQRGRLQDIGVEDLHIQIKSNNPDDIDMRKKKDEDYHFFLLLTEIAQAFERSMALIEQQMNSIKYILDLLEVKMQENRELYNKYSQNLLDIDIQFEFIETHPEQGFSQAREYLLSRGVDPQSLNSNTDIIDALESLRSLDSEEIEALDNHFQLLETDHKTFKERETTLHETLQEIESLKYSNLSQEEKLQALDAIQAKFGQAYLHEAASLSHQSTVSENVDEHVFQSSKEQAIDTSMIQQPVFR